jgi:predicted nucleotidyltransferase
MDKEALEKLEHLSVKSRELIVNFTVKIARAFEENLYSMILFGSAAGANFIEGKSDINTIIILKKIRMSDLEILMEVGEKFKGKRLAIPLIFEEGHIKSSLDTFPIEFSDMKQRHVLLDGEDPLVDAVIEKKNLRYQCEHEFKSVLVNLRRGFLRTGAKRENIESLLEESLSSVVASCRGMIWLADKTPPDDTSDLLSLVKEIYNTDTTAIDRVWRLEQGQSGATALLEALFEDYSVNIADLAAVADGLQD